jgi:hypothetical protein
MNLDTTKQILEIIALVITILGAPVAIFFYFKERRKERQDREYGTYNALDDKYIDFLNLCLTNADLGIYQMAEDVDKNLSEDQKQRRTVIFEILICLFERAYLMYKDQSEAIKRNQWAGWNAYIEDWMENVQFLDAWENTLSAQYDNDFLKHMNAIVARKRLIAKGVIDTTEVV